MAANRHNPITGSRTHPLTGLSGVLAVGVGVCTCLGQTASTQPAPPTTGPASRQPAYMRTAPVPEDMFGPRPQPPIILPSEPREPGSDQTSVSTGAIAKLPADMHRLPEGYVIAARQARITRDKDWYLAHLAPTPRLPDAPPLRILPNRRLTTIEGVLAEARAPLMFVVTGHVTEFQGVNYILIENLAEVSATRPAHGAGTKGPVSGSRGEDIGSASRPAGPEAAASAPANAAPLSPEQVIRQLMQDRPRKAVVLPDEPPVSAATTRKAPTNADSGESGATKDGPEWPEETLLADRNGRVVAGQNWWTFVFEDPGQAPQSKPVRVLPNRLLERAVALSEGGEKGIVFNISGVVTVHRGQNYLLLRRLVVRRDLGNLR